MDEKEIAIDKPGQTAVPKAKNEFNKVLQSMMIFLLSAAIACVLMPLISQSVGSSDAIKGHAIPSMIQISLTGIVLIIITSFLLNSIAKALGLTKAWLILAVCYSVACIALEFIILPFSMYNHSYDTGKFLSYDPNQSWVLVALAITTTFVGFILYLIFFKLHNKKSNVGKGSKKNVKPVIIVICIAISIILLFGRDLLFIALFFLLLPATDLIFGIFNNAGLSIVFILLSGLTLIALDISSRELNHITTKANDSTFLASVYWLSIVLIIAYNVLWVIFMIVMVGIWKFDTFHTSEGL